MKTPTAVTAWRVMFLSIAVAAIFGFGYSSARTAAAAPMAPDASVFCVDDNNATIDPAVCDNAGGTAFTTIQAAVTAASAGDEIRVAAGNYPGAVTFDKALTMIGGYPGGAAGWTTPGNASDTDINGTIDLAATLTGRNFTINGGSFGGAANFVINGLLLWEAGNMTGAGTTSVTAAGELDLNTGSGKFLNGRTLTNDGTVNWSDGGFLLANGATVNNNAGGNFNALSDSDVIFNGGNPVSFNNAGTFTKSAGALNNGTVFSTVQLNNSGTLRVQVGVVNPQGGGTNSGALNISNGAEFLINSGTYTFAAGTSLPGAGLLHQNGGTLSVNLNLTIPKLTQEGGFFGGSGNVSVPSFTWNAGTQQDAGTTTIPAGGTLTMSTGSSKVISGRAFTNNGTVNWSDGSLYLSNGAIFTNAAGANFNVQGDTDIIFNGGSPVSFNNAGTFTKSAGTPPGSTIVSGMPFNNTGTVLIQAGIFNPNTGGTNSGPLNISNGAEFLINSGTYTFAAGTTLPGAGLLHLTGGTLNINLSLTIPKLTQEGGFLGGSGNITINNYTWNAGTQQDTGTTTIPAAGTVVMTTSASKVLNGRSFTNNGTINWSDGGFYLSNAASFTNAAGGNFNIQNDVDIFFNGGAPVVFNNAGTVTKSAGGAPGISLVNGLPFNNTGVLRVQVGVFNPNGGGTNSGQINISSGAELFINAGTYNLAAGTTMPGSGLLHLSGGTLNANAALTIPQLLHDAGALGGSANLTVNNYTWNGGTQQDAGTTTIPAAGTMTLNGVGVTLNGRDLVNNGTTNWINTGSIFISNGATWTNAASGNFNVQTDADIFFNGGAPTAFNNAGTFTKSVGVPPNSTVVSGMPFNNTGTVRVQAGIFNPQGGGTNSGAINITNAANVEYLINSSTYNFAAGTTMTGAGLLHISAGTLNVNLNLTIPKLTQDGGFLGGTNNVTINALTWSAGTQQDAGTTTIPAAGTASFSGNGMNLSARDFVNNGTLNWTGTGSLFISNGAVFTNGAGALLDMHTDADIFFNGGAPAAFNNAGTFTKSLGVLPNTTIVSGMPFNNTGTVNVQQGIFNPQGGGTNSGAINISASCEYLINSGTYNFASGTTVTGAGLLHLSGGTLNINGNVSAPHVLQDGGILGGTATFTISNFDWNAGTQQDGGATTIPAAGTLDLKTGSSKIINTRTFNNNGTAVVQDSGSLFLATGAIFNNTATGSYELQSDSGIFFNGGSAVQFNNAGTLLKTAGGAAGSGLSSLLLTNTGIIRVEAGLFAISGGQFTQNNGGQTILDGGDIRNTIPLNLIGGSLSGTGAITGTVNNVGALVTPGFSPGLISTTNYSQGPTGTLAIQIGGLTAGTQFDQVKVSSAATLNGTLNVTLINGFTPLLGQSFIFMPYNTHSGTFSTVQLPSLPGGLHFEVQYQDTDARLVVVGNVTATPTVTRTPTQTMTPTRTRTTPPSNTPTLTSVPVTVTFTRTPVPATNTFTRTPVPATSTFTRTPNPNTATPTITPGGTNPTATNTRRPTITPRATRTATATQTPGGAPTATATPCNISFSDVHQGDYFYQGALYLACRGVISGYADGTFRPFADTTRSQVVKIIVLAEGYQQHLPANPTFSDVPTTNPFYNFIETAVFYQLISGYSDGTFKPFNNITRGQLCKVLVIGADWDLVDPVNQSFNDTPPENPFYVFIETAAQHGVISGYADGTFRWGANATRGQIAKIVHLAVTGPNITYAQKYSR